MSILTYLYLMLDLSGNLVNTFKFFIARLSIMNWMVSVMAVAVKATKGVLEGKSDLNSEQQE